MHAPDPDTKAAHKREQATKRKRKQRQREKFNPVVIEAVILRNIDSGLMTEEEAERAALSRKKVKSDLDEINLEWARRYIKKRKQA